MSFLSIVKILRGTVFLEEMRWDYNVLMKLPRQKGHRFNPDDLRSISRAAVAVSEKTAARVLLIE